MNRSQLVRIVFYRKREGPSSIETLPIAGNPNLMHDTGKVLCFEYNLLFSLSCSTSDVFLGALRKVGFSQVLTENITPNLPRLLEFHMTDNLSMRNGKWVRSHLLWTHWLRVIKNLTCKRNNI